MAHVLYTLGYTGLKPDDLISYLDHTGAMLVDVRFSAKSMQPRWTRKGLTEMVGQHRYIHIRALGNKNYKGGPVELLDPDGAVMEMAELLPLKPAILLCACADWRECHRTVAADWLANRLGPELVARIVHLPTRFSDYAPAQPAQQTEEP